jgi:DNA (cytosine-5)-methyltransferase 1
MKTIKVASLFSGCGGMDLGFEGGIMVAPKSIGPDDDFVLNPNNKSGYVTLKDLPFETVFACDVYPKAKVAWESYFAKRRNVQDVYHLESIVDIVKEMKLGVRKRLQGIDVVTGGFPCNDFSLAGNRLGFKSDKSHQGNKKLLDDVDDPTAENRGMLYYWMREFVSEVKPKVFYAENVKGLVSLGDAKEIIAKDFSNIKSAPYFILPVRVLNATHYGIPQTRERVIFIGVKKTSLRSNVLKYVNQNGTLPEELDLYPKPTHSNLLINTFGLKSIATCSDAFLGLDEPEAAEDLSQLNYSKAKYMGKKVQGQSETYLPSAGPTIRAEHHGNIEFRRLSLEHGGKNISELNAGLTERRLTVRECARIQTFPDDYDFVIPTKLSASDGYRLIGNAVPPLLAYRLAQRLEQVWDEVFKKS